MARLAESLSSDDPGATHSWTQVATVARTAGMQAAKVTAQLVPLCHPLLLSGLQVRTWFAAGRIEIEAETATYGPPGVEMEALTACAFAALALVAMLGPAHHSVSVEDLTLHEKTGGRSGHWTRETSKATIGDAQLRPTDIR
jgi:cyclic pyranopterin phosphate synthase